MISALVLVNTDIGEENKVLERVKTVAGVEEAHVLSGIYDLLIKIDANSVENLKDIISLNLGKQPGITNLKTLMINA